MNVPIEGLYEHKEKLVEYIKYLQGKKYKNEVEKQAEQDLTKLCHYLYDLSFRAQYPGEGPIG